MYEILVLCLDVMQNVGSYVLITNPCNTAEVGVNTITLTLLVWSYDL